MPYDNVIDWHVTPFRGERWLDAWQPTAAKALSFGATQWTITRSNDDTLHYRQTTRWNSKEDFEAWWYDDETIAARSEVINWHHKPLLPVWHDILGTANPAADAETASAAGS